MADIAISSALVLVEKVISFLQIETVLKKKVYDGVKDIEVWLKTMKAFLKDTEGIEGSEVLKDRVKQVRDIAYDIEDALAVFMVQVPLHFYTHAFSKKAQQVFHFFNDRSALHEMSSKIEDIKRKTSNILALDKLGTGRTILERGSSSSTTRRGGNHIVTPHILEGHEIIGFERPKEKIINQLINEEEPRRKTLAVVGPPGSGTSILVKLVYNDRRVRRKFDCHAWLHVTRSFQLEEILLNLLNQFCSGKEDKILHEGVDIREKLRHCLGQKMYVVVLDDVWSKQDWESITRALPNGLAGSKIIVTTQSPSVASSFVQSPRLIHVLDGLPWKMAWELFCKKAFNSRKCPPELEEWSQKIVKRCEGMPLLIMEIGSLLSKKQQLPTEWKKFHDSLGTEIGSNSDLSSLRVLLPSFHDLPSHLKSCFLYMSIFPDDYFVKRGRLIRSWVAEGFVKETRGKTFEDVAEEYLNELIGRNLVLTSAKDFDGRARSYRVLNLVRELIILKSEEDNFVTVIMEPNTNSEKKGEQGRRLSVHNVRTVNLSPPGLSSVRTLFMFGTLCMNEKNILLGHFKLLRVLDMQDSALDNFPEEIVSLTLLRYLSMRQTNITSVPKTIEKLAYLETLDLKHTQVSRLPKEILKLHKLRHLLVYHYEVNNCVNFDSARGVEIFAGIGALSAMQKFSLIKASKHRGIILELGKLVQLRKLGLVDLKREDGKNLCLSIQNMKRLSTLDVRSTRKKEYLDLDDLRDSPPRLLQRLYLKGRLSKFPGWISSLDSLVRIGLRWSGSKDNPLNVLQDLPNLMELQMVDAYIGQELIFKARKFKKLKILHIEHFESLNMMVVEQRSIPELKKLTIFACKNLELLPLGIGHLCQLEELLLYAMPNELIAKLQGNGEERQMVRHILVIHSFTLVQGSWSLQNLS